MQVTGIKASRKEGGTGPLKEPDLVARTRGVWIPLALSGPQFYKVRELDCTGRSRGPQASTPRQAASRSINRWGDVEKSDSRASLPETLAGNQNKDFG